MRCVNLIVSLANPYDKFVVPLCRSNYVYQCKRITLLTESRNTLNDILDFLHNIPNQRYVEAKPLELILNVKHFYFDFKWFIQHLEQVS